MKSKRTSKRAIASRANGARSRGPVTEQGKKRSSMNSIRHGLLARCVILCNESSDLFEQLCQQFIDKLQPADNVELACVEEMAAATWRLRRVMAIETNLMNKELQHHLGPDEFLCVVETFSKLAGGSELPLLDRYESRLHRLYSRSFHNLLRLQQLEKDRQAEAIAQHNEIAEEPNKPTEAQPPAGSDTCESSEPACDVPEPGNTSSPEAETPQRNDTSDGKTRESEQQTGSNPPNRSDEAIF